MNDLNCESCKISRRKLHVRGNTIVKMKGGWILNHFSGEDAYLGRLVLQPKCHRMDFDDLSVEEAASLGENVKQIIRELKNYWRKKFPNDCIKRVYVIYFFETPFAKPPPSKSWHMHIHLLPRTEQMIKGNSPTEVAAWKILELLDWESFPSEYRIVNKQCKKIKINENSVNELMEYLKESLYKYCKEL